MKLYRGHWVADYYDANKRRRIERPEGHFEKATQELHAAQVLLADRVAEVADGLVHEGRGTFEDAATRWLKGKVRVRPSTRRSAVLSQEAADAIDVPDVAVLLDTMEHPVPRLGTDDATAAATRKQILLTSLGSAYAEMERLQGTSASAWQWGRLHYNKLDHPFASVVDDAMRSSIDVGPLPKGGGPYTPNRSTYRTSDFRQTIGLSFRVIVDVGNWDNSRAVNHPGQSGDPQSPHYRDLAQSWLAGEYFPLLYSPRAIEAAAEARIVLVPAGQ